MRKIYVVFVLWVMVTVSANAQTAGFNSSFLILNTNGGGNQYYDLNATTANPDFNGANLGTFNVSNTLAFVGAEHNVYKCGGCDITATNLYYRIYPIYIGAPLPPAYVPNSIFFTSGGANGCGGADQQWSNTGGNVNLLASLTPARYQIDVYSNIVTTCLGGQVITPTYSATFIVCGTGSTWAGTTSTDWNVVTNWLCGNIPTAGDNVTIPLGAPNYPEITTGTARANNITIATGASVTVNSTGVFELYGAITNTGTFNLTAGTLNLTGTSPQTLAGTSVQAGEVKNLIITNNVTLSSEVKVITGLTFGTTGRTLTTGGNLTLVSTAAGTAYVGNTTGNTITGDASIERYLRAFRSWRFLATPITGSQTITDSYREGGIATASGAGNGYGTRITGATTGADAVVGADEISLRTSMKWYNSTSNDFVSITDVANQLARPEGYFVFVRGDRGTYIGNAPAPTTLRMRGSILTGPQTFNVPVNTLGLFQSVGNPYPSQIDFRSVDKTVADEYTVWNPNPVGSVYGVGKYEQYVNDGFGNYRIGGSLGNPIQNTIESGQAFFIQSIGAGSIIIREDDKTTGNNLVSRGGELGRTSVTDPTLEITLFAQNATTGAFYKADGILQKYDNSFNEVVDNGDVRKFMNNADNLFLANGTQKLIFERRKPLTVTDSIVLNLTNARVAPYKFVIDPSVLASTGLSAILKDKFLQTETPVSLTDSTTIPFNITADAASKVADRFIIVFRPAGGPLPVTFVDIAAAKNADKTNSVKWNVANELNIQQYEIERSGRGTNFVVIGSITAQNNTGGNYSYNFVDVAPLSADNYYRIKSTSVNGEVQYSTIVKVSADVKVPSIAVYPNPVEDKLVKIHFTGNESKYAVSLLNAAGKTVYTKNITVISESETQTIEVNKSFAAGNYTLVLVAQEGTKKILPIVIL